jgi:hypothetical protein
VAPEILRIWHICAHCLKLVPPFSVEDLPLMAWALAPEI